ncbi:MAG: ATPase [Actinomycetia bacterium]|nr:ATPase [Actinomycetes bacterium]
MASPSELLRAHTRYGRPLHAYLQRIISSWGMLADFAFADLLLFVPVAGEEGRRFVALAQVRPATGQTMYPQDLVGDITDDAARPFVARAYRLGEITEGEITIDEFGQRVRVLGIPVRFDGEVIGVITRESDPALARSEGELERTYALIAERLARMIAAGDFPYPEPDEPDEVEEEPRVGDGVVVLDVDSQISYASPNAVSALHRIGVHSTLVGRRLRDLGLDEAFLRRSFRSGTPVNEEIARGVDRAARIRALPLVERHRVAGGFLLVRDVSDVRRRDRLLLSKDATIREIHHRVKNNLQTISSLLRLQARRVAVPEAKAAIEESVRRIGSIAVVHETLAHAPHEAVEFLEIARPIVRMVEEGLVSPDRPVRFRLAGDAGLLPATVATSLAVILSELLQNAVDHAYPPSLAISDGEVDVVISRVGSQLVLHVIDDGVGVPEGGPDQDQEGGGGLGLTIVRTLVETELGGVIEFNRGRGVEPRPGSTVEIRFAPDTAEQLADGPNSPKPAPS